MRGHLIKRSKSSWTVVIPTGLEKPKQKWITVRGSKKEAEAEAARLLNELSTGGFVTAPNMRLGAYLDRWLETSAKQTVSPKTYERYQEIVEHHIKPPLGAIVLSKLKPMAIQKLYSDSLSAGRKDGKGGLSAQTVLHFHRVLHKALGQAVKWQLLSRNPADAVEPPRPERKPMRALDPAQTVELLAKLADSPLYAPVFVAVATGLRRGELLALKWQHVDLDRASLSVSDALEQVGREVRFKQPKTPRSRRTISLPSVIVDLLRAHRSQQAADRLRLGPAYQNHDLAFPRTDGTPWPPDTFSTLFATFIRSSGFDHVRFHDLRHTHASQLLLSGVHAKIVSERLGHSSIAITMDTYSHVLPGMQEDAAMKIDVAIRAALNKI